MPDLVRVSVALTSDLAAWAEDTEELLQALLQFQQQHYHGRDVSLWICTLANFQANDGSGPSVQEQVALDPFKQVIESPDVSCMVVVHTSQEDVYTRLWCIFELFVAQERGIDVFGAASEHYLNILRTEYSHLLQTVADGDQGVAFEFFAKQRLEVVARNAKCGNAADEKDLHNQVRLICLRTNDVTYSLTTSVCDQIESGLGYDILETVAYESGLVQDVSAM